jgi:hypothetical protein
MKFILSLLTVLFLATSCGRQSDTEETETIIDPVVPQPKFPGGIEGLNKYLKENYKWRQGQLTVAGTVFVQFLVLEDGSVSEAKIVRGLCETCDKEAIRLINEMPNWDPAIENGKPKAEKMILPIKFDLTNPYE